MVLSGMGDMEMMRDNVSYMKDFAPLSERERAAVDRVREIFRAQDLIPCTACRYCVPECPKKIPIPNLLRLHGTRESSFSRATAATITICTPRLAGARPNASNAGAARRRARSI